MALPAGPLKDARDALREQIAQLQAVVSIASNWVEHIESDRALLLPIDEAAFDAEFTPIAEQLLAELQYETSGTLVDGLNLRIKNTLEIKAWDPLTGGPL